MSGLSRPSNQEAVQDWLDRYVDAWMSYDPDDISGLFNEDVAYRYHPYDEPRLRTLRSRSTGTPWSLPAPTA